MYALTMKTTLDDKTQNIRCFIDEEVYSGDNCTCRPDNMHYRLSPTKRKRFHSRSSDQSKLQLPDCYDDKSAVLLKVKMFSTPPTPVRSSSLNRFQTIIAQQQKQV